MARCVLVKLLILGDLKDTFGSTGEFPWKSALLGIPGWGPVNPHTQGFTSREILEGRGFEEIPTFENFWGVILWGTCNKACPICCYTII